MMDVVEVLVVNARSLVQGTPGEALMELADHRLAEIDRRPPHARIVEEVRRHPLAGSAAQVENLEPALRRTELLDPLDHLHVRGQQVRRVVRVIVGCDFGIELFGVFDVVQAGDACRPQVSGAPVARTGLRTTGLSLGGPELERTCLATHSLAGQPDHACDYDDEAHDRRIAGVMPEKFPQLVSHLSYLPRSGFSDESPGSPH